MLRNLTKAENNLISERLRNWGRSISERASLKTSPLYWLRVSAAIADGTRRGSMPPPAMIDYADADDLQRHWRQLPEIPDRYQKAKRILFFWYACPHLSRRKIRNTLKIRDKEIDSLHEMGKALLYCNIYDAKTQNIEEIPNKTQNNV